MPPTPSTLSAHAVADRLALRGKLRLFTRHRLLDGGAAGLLVLLLWLLPWSFVMGQEPTVETPNRVKAAFLRNFAHYVTWPATSFENARSPWRIGILGNASLGEVVEKTLKGRTEQDRTFEIHCADSLEKLPPCQIIFIAFRDSERRHAVLVELKDQPVLTVGDATEILQEGGIVRFQVGERMRMSINLDQARAVSLKIQTKMLEVSSDVLENGVMRKMR
jgi:hypothetical protein